MKCPRCGAENPDYAFFCGRCAGDLKEAASAVSSEGVTASGRPMPTIENMLSRHLVRIEENLQKKRRGILRERRIWHQNENVVFRSERESVALNIDKDGHARLLKTPPTKPDVELAGPHEAFVTMIFDTLRVDPIPGSVTVTLAVEMPNSISMDIIAGEGAGKMLRRLFQ